MRVCMFPLLSVISTKGGESGIRRVVESYHRHSGEVGIQYVEIDPRERDGYDLLAIHAGMSSRWQPNMPLVSHCHGVYWSADYASADWEWRANRDVIASLRMAYTVTVPSNWVAETLQRDMHMTPLVVPHGIEWDEWQDKASDKGYVLWNKNRQADVCDPRPATELASLMPGVKFLMTFAGVPRTDNITTTGVVPHGEMRRMVKHASVYLSTTKETFGIGTLEAMASGVPVLGFAHGGNLDLVKHGVNGYLARPSDIVDLQAGLDYCLTHRKVLGENGRELARQFTWSKTMEKVRQSYDQALSIFDKEQRPMQVEQ